MLKSAVRFATEWCYGVLHIWVEPTHHNWAERLGLFLYWTAITALIIVGVPSALASLIVVCVCFGDAPAVHWGRIVILGLLGTIAIGLLMATLFGKP